MITAARARTHSRSRISSQLATSSAICGPAGTGWPRRTMASARTSNAPAP